VPQSKRRTGGNSYIAILNRRTSFWLIRQRVKSSKSLILDSPKRSEFQQPRTRSRLRVPSRVLPVIWRLSSSSGRRLARRPIYGRWALLRMKCSQAHTRSRLTQQLVGRAPCSREHSYLCASISRTFLRRRSRSLKKSFIKILCVEPLLYEVSCPS